MTMSDTEDDRCSCCNRHMPSCMSSSVVVNCCQAASCCFGCNCHWNSRDPSIVPVPRCTQHNAATWMRRLYGRHPNTKLRDLLLVGSHDSASNTISPTSCCSAVGICQNTTVYEQLLQGVRYLDLRLAGDKKDEEIFIFHGALQGGMFLEVLDDILRFCEEFPGEFLILKVVHEYGRDFSPKLKQRALDAIHTSLGDWVFHLETPSQLERPLGQLMGSGATSKVCVLLDNRFIEGFAFDPKYGFARAWQWLNDKWHNTKDPKEVLEKNLSEVRRNATLRRKFVNHQFLLTPAAPKTTAGDVFGYILGISSLQPYQLCTKGLYTSPDSARIPPRLHSFLADHINEPWNIVSLDFVDMSPSIVELCIGLNFGPIHVLWARLGTSVVTQKVRSKILRGKSLFLHVGPDLLEEKRVGSSSENRLIIVYRVAERMHFADMVVQADSVVILNEYNCDPATNTIQTEVAPKSATSISLEWNNQLVGYWDPPARIL